LTRPEAWCRGASISLICWARRLRRKRRESEMEQLIQQILNGQTKVKCVVVGCDYPQGVATIEGLEFREYYEPLERYKAYQFSAIYSCKDGEDITAQVQAQIRKVLAGRETKEQKAKEQEGAIAFERCWECGRVKIVGKMASGHVQRMEKQEWSKAQEAFQAAWKTQFAKEARIISSVGTNWIQKFQELGYKVVIVGETYCGC